MVYIVPSRTCYIGIHTLNIFREYSVLDFFAGSFSSFVHLHKSKTANCHKGAPGFECRTGGPGGGRLPRA